MRGPSLQKTALLSFALHLTVFFIAFLILRQSNYIAMPPPYTVSLVSPDVVTGIDKGKNADTGQESEKPSASSDIPKKNKKEIAKEKEMIEKKISTIAAKKKIEKMVKLRSIILLKATGDKRSITSKAPSASQGKSTLFDDYYSRITKEIWQQWVYPDIGKRDIEAIVSIRILKDGTAIVQRIEKSSGNALFDKSAIKALAKASPLSPPPYEVEIGVRFYP